MNKQAHEVILNLFCEQRGVSTATVSQGLADIICATTAPYLLMVECLDQLDAEDPVGGLLVTLIGRTYETSAGCLVLIALGQLREAEILSRSIFESAVTTTHIVRKDPQSDWHCSSAHMSDKKENRTGNGRTSSTMCRRNCKGITGLVLTKRTSHWTAMIGLSTGFYAIVRRAWKRATGGRISLTGCRRSGGVSNIVPCTRPCARRPIMMQRTSLTIYWSIASTRKTVGQSGWNRRADNFSIFLVLFGLRWFLEATRSVGAWARFASVVSEATVSVERIDQELGLIASHLDSGGFPGSWTTGSTE